MTAEEEKRKKAIADTIHDLQEIIAANFNLNKLEFGRQKTLEIMLSATMNLAGNIIFSSCYPERREKVKKVYDQFIALLWDSLQENLDAEEELRRNQKEHISDLLKGLFSEAHVVQ